jgi:hypothetical protein
MNTIIKEIQKPDFINKDYDEYLKWKEEQKQKMKEEQNETYEFND